MISLGGITGFAVAEEHVKTSGDLQLCTLVHGAHIRSSDGTDVGTVNDLIIDRQSGRVVNVVVATSEDKLVALPYSAVDTARLGEGGVIFVNIQRDRIVGAPTFSRTELRSLNRETIDRSVNYFGGGAVGRSTTTIGGGLEKGGVSKNQPAMERNARTAPVASPGEPQAVGESSPSSSPTPGRKARKAMRKSGVSPSPSASESPTPNSSLASPTPSNKTGSPSASPQTSASPRSLTTPSEEKASPSPAASERRLENSASQTPVPAKEKSSTPTRESSPVPMPGSTPK